LPFGIYPVPDREKLAISHSQGCRVSIAFRHLPHSRLEIKAAVEKPTMGLHCLSAFTPFPKQLLEKLNASRALIASPLPFGIYPVPDSGNITH